MSAVEPQPDQPVEPTPDEPAEPVTEPVTTTEEEEEETTEEEGEPAATEPAEPPPQAISEKQLTKMLDKLDSEAQRHAKRIREVMGDEADQLLPCPLCDNVIPGFVMPAPNVPERFPAVRSFMGDAQPRELQADPYSQLCDTCDGWGVVATGSHVPGKSEVPCLDCNGAGFRSDKRNVGPTQLPAPPVVPESNGPTHDAVTHEMPRLTPQQMEEKRRAESAGLIVLDMPRLVR